MPIRPIYPFAGLLCLFAAGQVPVFGAATPVSGGAHLPAASSTSIKVKRSSAYLLYPRRKVRKNALLSPAGGVKQSLWNASNRSKLRTPEQWSDADANRLLPRGSLPSLPRLPHPQGGRRCSSSGMVVAGWLRRELAVWNQSSQPGEGLACPEAIERLLSGFVFPILAFSRKKRKAAGMHCEEVPYRYAYITPKGELEPMFWGYLAKELKASQPREYATLKTLGYSHMRDQSEIRQLTAFQPPMDGLYSPLPSAVDSSTLSDSNKRCVYAMKQYFEKDTETPAAYFIHFSVPGQEAQAQLLTGLHRDPPGAADKEEESCLPWLAGEREQGKLYLAASSLAGELRFKDIASWLEMKRQALPGRSREAEEEHLMVCFTWAASKARQDRPCTMKSAAAPEEEEEESSTPASQLLAAWRCQQTLAGLNQELLHTLEAAWPARSVSSPASQAGITLSS